MSNCLDCDRLTNTAIDASGLYYDLLGKMEAAHISSDGDLALMIQMRLDEALIRRDKSVATILGHDGKLHTDEFWASTIFDAGDKAIQSWNRLSWFSESDIEIEDCNGRWRVNQATTQQWRRARTQDLQNSLRGLASAHRRI